MNTINMDGDTMKQNDPEATMTYLSNLVGGKIDSSSSIRVHSVRYAETLNLMQNHLGNQESMDVLDFGTSEGFMSLLVKHFFPSCSILACDIQINDSTRKLLQTHNIKTKEGATLVEGHKLPFPDHSFDAVMFLEVLEHVIADPKYVVQELHRICKPQGLLFLSTPNLACLMNRLMLLFGKQPQLYLTGLHNGDDPRHHFREWTMNELTFLLKDKFEILDTKYMRGLSRYGMISQKATLKLLYPFYSFLCLLKPSFRANIIIIGKAI